MPITHKLVIPNFVIIEIFKIKIGIRIGIGIGIEKQWDLTTKDWMFIVLRYYVSGVYTKASTLKGIHRHARDQWLRASQSVPLNIAEGNGKTGEADRRRYFEITRGSAMECAAIQDVLVVDKALNKQESRELELELDRIVVMLTRLGRRGFCVKENSTTYTSLETNYDCDHDPDFNSTRDLWVIGSANHLTPHKRGISTLVV